MSSREQAPGTPAATLPSSPAAIFTRPPVLQVTFSHVPRPAIPPTPVPAAGRTPARPGPAAAPPDQPGSPTAGDLIFQRLARGLVPPAAARPAPAAPSSPAPAAAPPAGAMALPDPPALPGHGIIGAWDPAAGTYVGYPATAAGRIAVTPSTYLVDAQGRLYLPGTQPAGELTIPAAPGLTFFIPGDHPADGGFAEAAGADRGPVFVLCCGRSGSTLLRLLLDAHPDLACPPETHAAALCAQLASMWSLLDGAPLPADPAGADPPAIPGPAIAGLRQSLDTMIAPYLARRGKKRYCDMSPGAAEHAGLLLRLFPAAKFICLYRHPMDVIASGLEACPWGLTGFGSDRYAGKFPVNAVLALARSWADHTAAIQAVEARFPRRCHQVRYEDLVTDPQATADQIFRFLGVSPQPGISGRCLSPERERHGRGDDKIWRTSRITAGSAGRGWSVPASLIEPAVAARINELAARLSYVPVDEKWGAAAAPADFRLAAADDPGPDPGPGPDPDFATMTMPRAFLLIGDLLQGGVLRIGDRFARQWGALAAESFRVMATCAATGSSVIWQVDLAARTVALARGHQPGAGAEWQVAGEAGAWEQVICGDVNLDVALRHRDLRYASPGGAPRAAPLRMSMLADLLGVTSWPTAEPDRSSPATAAPALA